MNKWKVLARALKYVFCVFSFVVFAISAVTNVVDVMHAETLTYAIFHTCFALLFGGLAFLYALPLIGK